jgi:hypothetical protein
MEPLGLLLGGVAALAGFVLALLNIRDKLWPPPPPEAHPLDAPLRDIATAIRERGPDFHLRLDKDKP